LLITAYEYTDTEKQRYRKALGQLQDARLDPLPPMLKAIAGVLVPGNI